MPKTETDWVTLRVEEALKAASVAAGIAEAIKEKLKGSMRERALRPGELNEFAKNLLAIAAEPPAEKSK